jgi:hypothetical protein
MSGARCPVSCQSDPGKEMEKILDQRDIHCLFFHVEEESNRCHVFLCLCFLGLRCTDCILARSLLLSAIRVWSIPSCVSIRIGADAHIAWGLLQESGRQNSMVLASDYVLVLYGDVDVAIAVGYGDNTRYAMGYEII